MTEPDASKAERKYDRCVRTQDELTVGCQHRCLVDRLIAGRYQGCMVLDNISSFSVYPWYGVLSQSIKKETLFRDVNSQPTTKARASSAC